MSNDLLVIDTETGGLRPEHHSLLSIGFVGWSDGVICGDGEILIREPRIIADEEALQVNRITLDYLRKEGLSPELALCRFEESVVRMFPESSADNPLVIAGHNVWFDIAFLKRLYQLADATFPTFFSHRILDTASILQFLRIAGHKSLGFGSSEDAFRAFGIMVDPKSRHTALGDARATASLITCLLSEFTGSDRG